MLSAYGFRGKILTWIKSFLSYRFQYVRINNQCSTPLPVISGVPQGSILGGCQRIRHMEDSPQKIRHKEDSPHNECDREFKRKGLFTLSAILVRSAVVHQIFDVSS